MFDVTALPANMRDKIMVSFSPALTNGTVCWEWTGALTSKGYGSMTNGRGSSKLTHRAAYETLAGPIERGLTIDHLCFNIICVNTDHMEVVTNAENNRRKNARQTRCKQGHELSGDNVRIARRKDWPQRVCVTCQRGWSRAYGAKRRAAAKVAA